MRDFTDQFVRLKPMPENGVGVEEAQVLHQYEDGTLLIRVNPEYYIDKADDGLRECTVDQISEVL